MEFFSGNVPTLMGEHTMCGKRKKHKLKGAVFEKAPTGKIASYLTLGTTHIMMSTKNQIFKPPCPHSPTIFFLNPQRRSFGARQHFTASFH